MLQICQPKILLAMEDFTIASQLSDILCSNGFEIKYTPSLTDALSLLEKESYDAILADITMSDGNGYVLCSAVRKTSNIPVIFVSACSDEQDVVTAFDMGAEDFIYVPFRPKELVSRVCRVTSRNINTNTTIRHRNIQVDTVKGLVTKNDKEIFLSALEYRILLLFLSNKGKILSREKLLEEIWSMDGNYINDNTLTVYIKRLREKLEDKPSSPQLIKTVRGKGYKTEI